MKHGSEEVEKEWIDHPIQPEHIVLYSEVVQGRAAPGELEDFDFEAVKEHILQCPLCREELLSWEQTQAFVEQRYQDSLAALLTDKQKEALQVELERIMEQWQPTHKSPAALISPTPASKTLMSEVDDLGQSKPKLMAGSEMEFSKQTHLWTYFRQAPYRNYRLKWGALAGLTVIALLFVVRSQLAPSPLLLDTNGQVSQARDGQYVFPSEIKISTDVRQQVKQLVESGSVKSVVDTSQLLKPVVGVRGASKAKAPRILQPVGTFVRTLEPTLSWEGNMQTGVYAVVVREAANIDNEIFDDKDIRQPEVKLNKTNGLKKTLEYGHAYEWQVYAGNTYSGWVTFATLPQKAILSVEGLERKYQGSALILAAVYQSYGLYDDALEEINKLAEKNPNNPSIDRMILNIEKRNSND